MSFSIFCRHRVCLVDHVDLIFSLYSWWEGSGSSSLTTQPSGFQLWFYFHLCIWVIHWGLLLRLLWRTWVCPTEGQVWRWCSWWVTGVLAAPGTQGRGWLGQQEIQCSRRVWQPVLANTLQYCCLEIPLGRKAWQATVHRVTKSWTRPKQPRMHRHKTFFFACGSSAPVTVEHEGKAAAWFVGTLVVPSVQGHRLPQSLELWPYQSLFPNLL